MELVFWILPNSGLETMSHLNAILAKFNTFYPEIRVKPQVLIDKTLWQRLFLSRRQDPGFELPDLVEIPHYWTALFSRLGMFENLTGLDASLSVENCILPLKPHCFLPGSREIYSVPWWMSVTALHYRVDHLNKVTGNPENLLKTWDGLLSACGALKNRFRTCDYFPVANSSLRGLLTLREVLPFIWERGGDLFDSRLKKPTIHNDAVIKGIEDFLILFERGFMPLMREKGSLGTMAEGKASMVLTRRQSQAVFDESFQTSLSLKTLPVPGLRASSISFMTSYNLSISKSSSKKKQALELVKWLCSDEYSTQYSKLIKAFPCTTEGFEKFIFSSQERMKTYAEIVAKARCLANTPVCATYVGLLDEVLAHICWEMVKGRSVGGLLMEQLNKVQVEVDYLMSLYGD
jgi:ABC-type glycerol-3-phosphate transport system substrate-binding protein